MKNPYSAKYQTGKQITATGLLGLFLFLSQLNMASAQVNTGIVDDSTVGNNNMESTDTGVAVNGDTNESNLNNNQNNLVVGDSTNANRNQNTNANLVNPVLYSPSQSMGGNSALVMPRNPLPLPNASLGRKNFGLQFGVQNNPGLASFMGTDSAMSWFLQGGLTIPFGKIPEVYNTRETRKVDAVRQRRRENERDVFGKVASNTETSRGKKEVSGKVLNAYNYSTASAGKLSPEIRLSGLSGFSSSSPQPKILTLSPGDVYTQPLDTGDKVGVVEVGKEYPYLGHISSGWVKLLLPDGREGWTRAPFEYLKFDYTEIDQLAAKAQETKTARR